MKNEFAEDLNCTPSRDREKGKAKDRRGRFPYKFTTLATGVRDIQSGQRRGSQGIDGTKLRCLVCSNQHGVWRCGKFKGLSYQDRMKIVQEHQEHNLCINCLSKNMPKDKFQIPERRI